MRKKVIFSGHVQGVGFRYTAAIAARSYNVGGYIQNQTDGSVLLILEGPAKEVNGLIEEIKSRKSMNISSVFENEQPAHGEFNSFDIRY